MRSLHRLRSRAFRRDGTDDGMALAVALIFILVVGIMVTAALSKTGAVLKTDYLVRQQSQVQYAADAGIERALQVLRDDVSSNPAHFCPTTTAPGATDVDMTSSSDPSSKDPGGLAFNVNLGVSGSPPLRVHYACHTLAGGVPDDTQFTTPGFAIVTTGNKTTGGVDGTLSTTNGVGSTLDVNGPIYMAGKGAIGDFNKTITISNGDFVEFDKGDLAGCTSNLKTIAPTDGSGKIIIGTPATYSSTCAAETPVEAVQTTNLPAAPGTAPPAMNFPLTGTATCKVFFPGTYTAAPALLTPHGGGTPEANYFVSGRYNFDGIGNWTVDNGAIVFGGQPGTGDATAVPGGSVASISDTGCAAFKNADAAAIKTLLALTSSPVGEWPFGTQFVMGGTSTVVIKNGFLSLYTPPTDAAYLPGPAASLIAARSAGWTPTGPTDSARGYTPWAGSQPVTSCAGACNNVGFVANGQILAPNADVSLTGTNGTVAVARAGIVGATVTLAATASVSGGNFFFNPFGNGTGHGIPPERRTVKVTACVDPANPSANCIASPTSGTFTETALATIDNFGIRPIRVFTWRAT